MDGWTPSLLWRRISCALARRECRKGRKGSLKIARNSFASSLKPARNISLSRKKMREKASYVLRKVRENLLYRGTDGLRSSVYCLAGNGAAFGTDPCGGQECISALSLIKISTIRFCRALSSVPDISRLLSLFADRSPPWHCCRV